MTRYDPVCTLSEAKDPGLTPEEIQQMDEAYYKYDKTCKAYLALIDLEEDPVRKEQLGNLLADLHEDNK